jgi:hypothetical protein
MRRMFVVASFAATLLGVACSHPDYAKTPEVYGFESCSDPRIARSPRLTIDESGEISLRLQARENRVESEREASALFARSSISRGFFAANSIDAADHSPIDAFVHGTDFTRDELILVRESVTGSDGYAGTMSSHGRTAIVAHRCGAMGGAVTPTANWIGVYRVPRGNVVSTVGCEPCPVFVCCPP